MGIWQCLFCRRKLGKIYYYFEEVQKNLSQLTKSWIFYPKKYFLALRNVGSGSEMRGGKKTLLRMFWKVNVGISAVAGVLPAAGVPAAA